MRFLVAILIIWLFFFYNIERLSRPVNITKVAYLLVPFMGVLAILVPHLRKVPLWAILGAPVPVFLILKYWSGEPVVGASLPLTVTEICILAVTIILVRWVSNGLGEFEEAVVHITIGQHDRLPESFSTSQGEMYRELRRARHYQRPLALMAIGVEKKSMEVAVDRMVQEVQQAMVREYVLSDVAKKLVDGLEDYNVIARRNEHFLILLPEVSSNDLPALVARLRQAMAEQTGVTLQIGCSSFPEDAVTFDSLVEQAVKAMDGKREEAHSALSPQLATEQRTTYPL